MNLRGYGAFATGILASVFGFDFLWTLTQLDAFEAFFLAMCIGFVSVVVYALATEPKSRRRAYVWETDDTGLSYMRRRR